MSHFLLGFVIKTLTPTHDKAATPHLCLCSKTQEFIQGNPFIIEKNERILSSASLFNGWSRDHFSYFPGTVVLTGKEACF